MPDPLAYARQIMSGVPATPTPPVTMTTDVVIIADHAPTTDHLDPEGTS